MGGRLQLQSTIKIRVWLLGMACLDGRYILVTSLMSPRTIDLLTDHCSRPVLRACCVCPSAPAIATCSEGLRWDCSFVPMRTATCIQTLGINRGSVWLPVCRLLSRAEPNRQCNCMCGSWSLSSLSQSPSDKPCFHTPFTRVLLCVNFVGIQVALPCHDLFTAWNQDSACRGRLSAFQASGEAEAAFRRTGWCLHAVGIVQPSAVKGRS